MAARAVGRTAPARRCRPRDRHRSTDSADGRAVWRTRQHHAAGASGRIPAHPAAPAPDDDRRHARHGGSARARRSCRRPRGRTRHVRAHRPDALIMRLLSFWMSHGEELAAMIERHLFLVLWSTTIAMAIGLPAGIVAAHRPRIGRPLLAAASIAQTIPSLALLGFLLPIPFIGGIGPRIAIVALILYALLPIVRSTAAGLRSIDPAVIDAGVAMGMTARQLLWLVELPLALPSIVAGGLGEYIFRGLSMVDSTVILAGAIPAALMALVADGILTWVERRLSPG